MSDNPYQATNVMADLPDSGTDPKLERAASLLQQTKPWVRFISVMMFIASAFMVLGGIVAMIGGAMGGVGVMPAVFGFFYLIMALFYIMPAVFLWKYADRIALFVDQRSTAALASALEAQKSFWKFVGIVMLVVMALYAIGIAIAIGVGVVSSM